MRSLRTGPPPQGGMAHRAVPPSMAPTRERRPSMACLRHTPWDGVLGGGRWGHDFDWRRETSPSPTGRGVGGEGRCAGVARDPYPHPLPLSRWERGARAKPPPKCSRRRGSAGVWRKRHMDVPRSRTQRERQGTGRVATRQPSPAPSFIPGADAEPRDAPYPRAAAAPSEADPPDAVAVAVAVVAVAAVVAVTVAALATAAGLPGREGRVLTPQRPRRARPRGRGGSWSGLR